MPSLRAEGVWVVGGGNATEKKAAEKRRERERGYRERVLRMTGGVHVGPTIFFNYCVCEADMWVHSFYYFSDRIAI
jgi:hypothetical protein